MGSSLNAKKKNSKRDEILNTTYPDDKHYRNLIAYQNFWKEHLFIKGNKINVQQLRYVLNKKKFIHFKIFILIINISSYWNDNFYSSIIYLKVDQKFAVEFETNFTIPPDCRDPIPKYESKDDAIELIGTKVFYPHKDGIDGGDSYKVYIFKATEKGKFKIKFSDYTIDVKAK